jgi:hypothetical protein
MAIEGKALSRSRIVGGRPRRKVERRAEIAFGLLSIAVARLGVARCGLTWAAVMRNGTAHEEARNVSRALNGVITTVTIDFACATIQQRPFRNRCASRAGHRGRSDFFVARVKPEAELAVQERQSNPEDRSTQPFPWDCRQIRPSRTGITPNHYRCRGPFGKMLRHCDPNATMTKHQSSPV